MSCTVEESSKSTYRCGQEQSFSQLLLKCTTQKEKPKHKKRKLVEYELPGKTTVEELLAGKYELISGSKPMTPYGVPANECPVLSRNLNIPKRDIGPPYFYYENVAKAPKGVWNTISRFLYDIPPEFVNSKDLCATARNRGYIHNLPKNKRFHLEPKTPQTIQDALPHTKEYWPSWDTRTKLNCLTTRFASRKETEKICKAIEECDDETPAMVKKCILGKCRKLNLVWVGKTRVAPLQCDEVENLLGFPKDHTRGDKITKMNCKTYRYKSLGNSFQVDTVAFHLSVLKHLFPNGLNILSLFSGIGGAEVALHRLGIPLKNVVSVEILEMNKNILRRWWEKTEQKGNLIQFSDIRELDGAKLEEIMHMVGGFDLVIGGSPCNNLSGCNQKTRTGLHGDQSSLFFDYVRILNLVQNITSLSRQKYHVSN